MEEVMNALQQIDWDQLGQLCTDFIAQMDIPGFFASFVEFVKNLIAAIVGSPE